MTVAIVVPVHGEDRLPGAAWIIGRLTTLHPSWPLTVADGEPWTKARAVNAAVPDDAEILVICDADVAVPPEQLLWAVRRVRDDGEAWAVPFGRVYRLSLERTTEVIALPLATPITHLDAKACVAHRPPYDGVPGGGVLVVSREAWGIVGGFDDRFTWGQEDVPLACALDTLAGDHVQHDGPLWHLFHPARRTRREMYHDMALEARYLHANGKPEAMRHLIAEGRRAVPHARNTPV